MNISKKLVYKKKNSKMFLADNSKNETSKDFTSLDNMNPIPHCKTSKNDDFNNNQFQKNISIKGHYHKSSNFNFKLPQDFIIPKDNMMEEEISPKKSKMKLVKLIEPQKDKNEKKSKSKEKKTKNFMSKESSKKTLQLVSTKSIFNFGSDQDNDNKSRNILNMTNMTMNMNTNSNNHITKKKSVFDNYNTDKFDYNFTEIVPRTRQTQNYNEIHKAIEKLNLNQYKKAETLKPITTNAFTPIVKSNYNNVMSKKELGEFVKNINISQKRKSNFIINMLKQEKLQNNLVENIKTDILNKQLRNKRFEYENKKVLMDFIKQNQSPINKSKSIENDETKKNTIKNNQIFVKIDSLTKNNKKDACNNNLNNNIKTKQGNEDKKSFHLFLKDMNANRDSIKNPEIKKLKILKQNEGKNDNEPTSKDSPNNNNIDNKVTSSIFSNLVDRTAKTSNKSKFKDIFKSIGKKKEQAKLEDAKATNQNEETDLFKLIKLENTEKGTTSKF